LRFTELGVSGVFYYKKWSNIMAKYLVCDAPDPAENVEYYTLVGLPGNPTVPADTSEGYGFKYDLSDLAPGTYSLMASACNDWGCSLEAPFGFVRPPNPSSPLNLRLL
jgi:hypothetical protein